MKARLLLMPLLAATAIAAHAQVQVTDAWVRGTVAQQTTTGLFFDITSAQGGKLVAASTPVAREVQLHTMAMKGNVMTMREVPAIELPAGKTVRLQPNGLHVMLFGLTHTLSSGETVLATLIVEDARGKRDSVQVQARVEALGAPHSPQSMPAMSAASGAMK